MPALGFVRAAALAVIALLAPAAANACSTVPGYVRPSNFELVQGAEAIVIATPVRDRIAGDDAVFGESVTFKIQESLKGDLSGEVEVARLQIGPTQPSDPDNIAWSHPEGHAGPCNRVTVSKDATYILFLDRFRGQYHPGGGPFSRVVEDYAGEDALWTRTVRTYLALQRTDPPMAQIEKLAAMRAEILAKPAPTPHEKALADDIQAHLGSISRWKPTEFLLAAYADHKAGRPPRYGARDKAFDEEQSDAQAMTEALMGILTGEESVESAVPRDAYQDAIFNALLEGDHPGAMPLFEGFARPDAPPEELAMAIRFFARNGRYPEAYGLVKRGAAQMETAPEEDFYRLGWAISEAQEDPFYGEGEPRWRSHPAVAADWPRLALRLATLAERRFDGRLSFAETLKGLETGDYRADPALTLARSGDDNDIIDWAVEELTNPDNLRAGAGEVAGTAEDPLLLPLQIILRWHGPADEEVEFPAIARVFCLGPAQRQSVFRQWGELGGWQSQLAIMRLAASNVMESPDRAMLAQAIPDWDRRYRDEMESSYVAEDPAMQKLARGEPVTAKDIEPLQPARCPA